MTKSILCPVDGTDHSDVGLMRAAELAKATNSHLTVCAVNLALGGVRGGPTTNHWEDAEAQRIVSEAETKAKAAGAKDVSTAVILSHEAGPAIIRYAEEIGADQIVMGTGDKRGVKRLVLGSVAAEVAGHASCSVTVAR